MVYMEIVGYTDENFSESKVFGTYTVMINPESIKWDRPITYTKQAATDASAPDLKYNSTPAVNLSFDIVIDCTGIVDKERIDMATEIKELEDIVYTYNGQIHRPNYVRIKWGSNNSFYSVLKSFNTTYTLFNAEGNPLRAKISMSFGQYVAKKKRKKKEKKKSPDITHYVVVVEGDSLPQLCDKVWDTPYNYIQVAQYNDLNKFRNLKGGQQLVFPPIIKPN